MTGKRSKYRFSLLKVKKMHVGSMPDGSTLALHTGHVLVRKAGKFEFLSSTDTFRVLTIKNDVCPVGSVSPRTNQSEKHLVSFI